MERPYRKADGKGGWLEIAVPAGRQDCVVTTGAGGAVVVPEDLPAITAALYEACGVQPPRRPLAWVRITVPSWLYRILIAAGAQEARDA
ncbi:MAG TPA: hypothetical protein VK586_02915 [Streptosporangiaceae bacterium]|nr:hypothetical protein [Streptosporangiaceae bacterium]